MKPNDKPKKAKEVYEDPQLFIVIGKEVFPRPGLETAFVDYSGINPETTEQMRGCLCDPVGTTICTCNKVRICNCVGYVAPKKSTTKQSTTRSSSSSSGCTHGSGCQCAPVH